MWVVMMSEMSALHSHSTTNKMHLLSQIICSSKTLYMFRTDFPSIIRSWKLFIQQRYMSNSCCYLLLSGIWYDIFINCNWVVTPWQYTFTHKQYIEQQKITTNLEEYGQCPVFACFTLAFALQLRKKHGKTWVRVRKTSVRVQYTYYQNTHTLQKPTHTHTHTHTHYKTHTCTHTHTHITKQY